MGLLEVAVALTRALTPAHTISTVPCHHLRKNQTASKAQLPRRNDDLGLCGSFGRGTLALQSCKSHFFNTAKGQERTPPPPRTSAPCRSSA